MNDEQIDFTWRVTPLEPINGQGVKTGDTQRLPRAQAERYELCDYGYIGKPDTRPQRMVKVRMLAPVFGTFHGNDAGVRRGDVVTLPERDALKYIGNGQATEDLDGDLWDRLPYEATTAEAVAAQKKIAVQRPPREPVLVTRARPAYRRVREGWMP